MGQVSYGTITITDTNDIERIYMEYAQSSSNSTAPTTGWSENIPAWEQGKYIWQRTVVKKEGVALSSDSYGDPVCLTGSTGSTGSPGATGRGVSSIVTTYCNYGTGTPAANYSGWSSTVPTYDSTEPNYWIKTVITYTSGTPATDTKIYQDNGITSATATAANAKTQAAAAEGKADSAVSTANTANTNASNALSIANGVNQHFWSLAEDTTTTGGTLAAGQYITDILQSSFKQNPNSSGNLLLRSDGVYLNLGLQTLASFKSNALTFYNSAGAELGKFGSDGLEMSGTLNIKGGGRIGQDSTNYWQFGDNVGYNVSTAAYLIGKGNSSIQLGENGHWRIDKNRIHTGWYVIGDSSSSTPAGSLHFDTYNENRTSTSSGDQYYWDYGLHFPVSNTVPSNNKFLYIRYSKGTVATTTLSQMKGRIDNDNYWNYKFYIDDLGNVHAPGFYIGESTTPIGGGAGTVAERLTQGYGSASQPIYFNTNGVPTNTTYQLNAAGAKGVDTSISAASTSTNLPTSQAVAAFVEGKGYITSYTDNKVQTSQANTTKVFLAGTSTTGTSTGTLNFDSNVYLTTTAGTLHATTFEGNLSGTASRATADGDGNTIKTTYLKLNGGNVTGAVTFGSSVSADELTVGDLVVNGAASFTNNLQANTINGVAVGSNPKFTDTTYTFANGTNGFTVTPLGGTAQTVTVTPSIANNITGSGTSGYLAKFTGANTIGNGPALGSDTTKFLNNKGEWAVPTGTYTYTLPLAANGTRGGVQIGFTTNNTNRNYAVALSGEKMYVNVPWENTTYSAGTGLSLSGTTFSNTGVLSIKGNAESTYRTGQINLTAANIGAVALSGNETISGDKNFTGTTNITYNSTYSISNTAAYGSLSNGIIYAPMSKYLWHDLFAFGNHGYPTFYTSTDNSTWTEATLDKRHFICLENLSINIIAATGRTGARWVWNNANFSYSGGVWLVIGIAYSASQATINIVLESSTDGSTWTVRHNSSKTTSSQPIWCPVSNYANARYIRLTITKDTSDTTKTCNINAIKLLTSRWGDQGGGSEYEYPYTWDVNKNVTFSAQVTATQFNGLLNGNASSATIASGVKDSGNNTTTTFAYSKAGLTTASWLAAWSGYELRAISPSVVKDLLSLSKSDVGLDNVLNVKQVTGIGQGENGTIRVYKGTGANDYEDIPVEIVATETSSVQSAQKLSSYGGATNKPVYFPSTGINAGKPVAIDYEINKSVPSNAVFTDTTYTAGSGLTLDGTQFKHSNSITAGTISDGGNTRTLAFGGTFKIPSVTYDAQGHIKSTTTITLTMPAAPSSTGSATNDSDGNPINTTYLKKSGGVMTGAISRAGVSTNWNKGRDNVLIKTTSINGYSPLWSAKTNNGSWDVGTYDNTSYTDDLVFSYITDADYANTNKTPPQIKFLENGHIVANLDGNAATATSATSAITASKLGSSTVGSARQAIYLNAGTATAGNYTVAHLGNAGKSNMNDVGRLHASVGMTNLTDPSNNTDNPMNGTTKSTSWHLYWNANYTDDPSGSNAWVAQIVNKAGTAQWWVRSRSGGTITNGTAWAADWKHLVVAPQAGQGSDTVPIYIDANGHTQSIMSYSGKAATAGTADKATKANLTTTTNAIAYYTDTTGTFGSKASANGVLYATSANGALNWGTLPIAQGGTGATSAVNATWNLLHVADPGDLNTAKRGGSFKISNTTTNTPVASMWGATINVTDDSAGGNTGTAGSTWQIVLQSASNNMWLRCITNASNWTDYAKFYTTANKPTKSDVGLGNVENKSSATIRGELTSSNVTTALGYTPVNKAGDTMTGSLKWNATSLPQFSGTPEYLVGIDAFASGGTMKWQSVGNITVGAATKATQDKNGNDITTKYVTIDTDQTITASQKTFNGAIRWGSTSKYGAAHYDSTLEAIVFTFA